MGVRHCGHVSCHKKCSMASNYHPQLCTTRTYTESEFASSRTLDLLSNCSSINHGKNRWRYWSIGPKETQVALFRDMDFL